MNFTIKKIGIAVLGSGFIFSLIKSVSSFWRGYHDLDLSFNMLNLGHKVDMMNNGVIITLNEAYLQGLNLIRSGFEFMAWCIVLAFLLGFVIRRVKE